jgi:hypothetical protein
MCDVCRNYQLNWKQLNGQKMYLEDKRLYTFYHRHRARLTLCHSHAVDLFHLGERRFLDRYRRLAQDLVEHKQQYVVLS